jgi:thymidylate kinase
MSRTGAHIAFAGIDGAGKSTQGGKLAKRLNDLGFVAYLFEGKEDFAVQVMRAVAAKRGARTIRAFFGHEGTDLAKAFDTLRDQIHIVEPLKKNGCIVVQPRTGFDRIALAKSFGSSNLEQVEAVTLFGGCPDLTLWLDVPVELAVERITRRGIDSEDPEMLRRFRGSLGEMAQQHPWVKLCGCGDATEVHQRIWQVVEQWLQRERPTLTRLEREAT